MYVFEYLYIHYNVIKVHSSRFFDLITFSGYREFIEFRDEYEIFNGRKKKWENEKKIVFKQMKTGNDDKKYRIGGEENRSSVIYRKFNL